MTQGSGRINKNARRKRVRVARLVPAAIKAIAAEAQGDTATVFPLDCQGPGYVNIDAMIGSKV